MHTHFFKKLHFAKWGGTQEFGLKWGGVKVRNQKMGGGTELRPKAARFRVPPLSMFLAPSLSYVRLTMFNA